jgi:hypothetical protein
MNRILEDADCLLCRYCKCSNNKCCFSIKKKPKLKRILLQSGRRISVCSHDHKEFLRIKLLLDLLLETKEQYQSRENSASESGDVKGEDTWPLIDMPELEVAV